MYTDISTYLTLRESWTLQLKTDRLPDGTLKLTSFKFPNFFRKFVTLVSLKLYLRGNKSRRLRKYSLAKKLGLLDAKCTHVQYVQYVP